MMLPPPVSPQFPAPPPPSRNWWTVVAAVLGMALIALSAFVAASALIEKKRDVPAPAAPVASAPLAPPTEPESGDRTYIIEGGEGSLVEGECLAMGRPPAVCKQERANAYPGAAPMAPAPAPAALPSADKERAYTQALMADPTATLRDPGRLVSLGNATCRYLDAASGTPESNALHLGEFLKMRQISKADALAIVAGSLEYLCPQYRDKLGG